MKYYIETLGCPKNTVDSENMAALLEQAGHREAELPEQADVLIVNTCAFIHDAKTESIDTIFDMALYKENAEKLLVVTGCLSQRYAEELYREIPEADLILGVNDYHRLPQILAEHVAGKREYIQTAAPGEFCEIAERKTEPGAFSSYLRIAEGCDNVCSYCVIPYIRGAYRSRRMEAIVQEAERLASRGTKELILIAQDVTAYGKDLYQRLALPELLRKLCRIDGIRWIRLLYCYEDSITPELIETMRTEEKICSYIDIPLQHISDPVLVQMNRHSTEASIRQTIQSLRDAIPDIHIRTTFITGFPGETEKDYRKLQAFVEETEFERLGVFAYSQEEGTPAGDMINQIPEVLREERRDAIMEIQRSVSLQKNLSKVGTTLQVLVEERCEDGTYIGRTQYDAPDIDNGVIFTSEQLLEPGSFVMVHITDAFDYDLTGTVECTNE